MSSPAPELENLTISEEMGPRTRARLLPTIINGPSGRQYDLSSFNTACEGAAVDGLRSKRMRLLPLMTNAVVPESGFYGFEVAEIHRVRVPSPEDEEESSDREEESSDEEDSSEKLARAVQCDCATFQRLQVCPHTVWLYDGLQACSLMAEPTDPTSPEELSEAYLQQRFVRLARRIQRGTNEASAYELIEKINTLQPEQADKDKVKQDVLDIFAIFDGTAEDSRRKRRRESPEGSAPVEPNLGTCLEVDTVEFFGRIKAPTSHIREVIVPGDLPATMKSWALHSTIFRDVLDSVMDSRYRARDFIIRVESSFLEEHERWIKTATDRRTSVRDYLLPNFAKLVRHQVRLLYRYSNERDCPDSYYRDAIELVIDMLEKLCNTNFDVYEGHTRQTRTPGRSIPEQPRQRNLFVNLFSSPPTPGENLITQVHGLLSSIASRHMNGAHMERLKDVIYTLDEEGADPQQVVLIKSLFDRFARERSQQSQSSKSNHSRASTVTQSAHSRRYRELQAAQRSD